MPFGSITWRLIKDSSVADFHGSLFFTLHRSYSGSDSGSVSHSLIKGRMSGSLMILNPPMELDRRLSIENSSMISMCNMLEWSFALIRYLTVMR